MTPAKRARPPGRPVAPEPGNGALMSKRPENENMETKTERIPHGLRNARAWTASALEMLAAVDAADSPDAREAAERAIQESPLSMEWRSGWVLDPYALGGAAEACLLLSTGGPALRLLVNCDGGVSNPRLEWSDWGTPWTLAPLSREEEEAWERFADTCGAACHK